MSDLQILSKNIGQFFRYVMVGISVNASAYLIYLILTYVGTTPKLTMTLIYCINASLGYFGNRRLTFAYKGPMARTIFRYLVAHSGGYLINLTILVIFVDKLGFSHQFIQIIAILLVALFLFFAFKFFVFGLKHDKFFEVKT